jgi:hypothetical protein
MPPIATSSTMQVTEVEKKMILERRRLNSAVQAVEDLVRRDELLRGLMLTNMMKVVPERGSANGDAPAKRRRRRRRKNKTAVKK